MFGTYVGLQVPGSTISSGSVGPSEPSPNPETGGTCITDPYYFLAQADTALDTYYFWGSAVTFSNSNRTVDFTSLSGGSGVVTYVAHATGKYYFEIVRNSGDLYGAWVRDDYGCARAPRDLYGQYVAEGIAYRRGGLILINGASVLGAPALLNGDVIGFAVDLDSHKVWVSRNGAWLTGDPSSGTSPVTSSLGGGYYHIGISGEGGSAANMTVNARDSDLVYPKPTGFSSWTTAAVTAGPITSLSIHANSNFRDYSAAEKEIRAYSPVSLDSSVKKFDSGSGNFTLANSGLWVSPATVGFGSTALTIEAQIYPTLIAGDTRCIVSVAEPYSATLANMYIGVLSDGSLSAFIRTATGGSTVQFSSPAGAVALNAWQHAELGIDGSNAYLFLEGSLVASTSSWTTYPAAKVNYCAVGRLTSQFPNVDYLQFRGNIDEVHVTKNLCKHTSSFSAPAHAYCEFPSYASVGTPSPPTVTAAAGSVTVGASVSMGGTMGPVPPALFTVGIRAKSGALGQPKTLAQGATTFQGEILASAGGPAYTVEWETYNIAAVPGVNYTASSGSVGASDATPQPISVTVVPPANYYGAPGYIFGVRIKNPTGRTIAAGADHIVVTAPSNTTIPTLTYAATSTPGNFGLFAEYEWTLSHPSAFPESIQYSLGMLPASPAYTSGSILSSQYSIDGGATYLPLGPGGGGTFVLPAMTSSFRIRQNTTLQAVQNANINPTLQMGLFSPMWQFQYVNGPLFWLPAP